MKNNNLTNEEKELQQGYPLFYIEDKGYTDIEIKQMSIEEVKLLISFQKIKGDIIEIATVYDNIDILNYATRIVESTK